MDSQIKQRMVHKIEWFKYLGRDGMGDKNFDPAQELKGYAYGKVGIIRNAEGQEVTTTMAIYFSEEIPDIAFSDELVVKGIRYPVQLVQEFPSPFNSKPELWVVYV